MEIPYSTARHRQVLMNDVRVCPTPDATRSTLSRSSGGTVIVISRREPRNTHSR